MSRNQRRSTTFRLPLVPLVPSVAAGTGDTFVLLSVRAYRHTHPTSLPALCENVLIFNIRNEKTITDRPLKSFKLVATHASGGSPVVFDCLPGPVNFPSASRQIVSLEEGVSDFLHDSDASTATSHGEIKVATRPLRKMGGLYPRKRYARSTASVLRSSLRIPNHPTITKQYVKNMIPMSVLLASHITRRANSDILLSGCSLWFSVS